MRYSTVFKFFAVILCAATLLGALSSGAALVLLTELGGKSVQEAYADQLRSQAIGFAQIAGDRYLSESLGGANRQLVNYRYGNDWESIFFDWTRVGYTLYDPEGNVVHEQEMPGQYAPAVTFGDIPVSGEYIQVVSTMTEEAYTQLHQETIPQTLPADGIQVAVMPGQGITEIGTVVLDYTDGTMQQWNTGEVIGTLSLNGADVEFHSAVGEPPMGDGWYPNHVFMLDMGGNVVYEAYSDTMVLKGTALDNGSAIWYLPAGTVTMAAPVGVTYTEGDYTSYDAIPAQGVTVSQMNVTYGTQTDGDLGSEGIASPELIGTVFHDHLGNAQFHSTDPMTMDIPEDSIITHIAFVDGQSNLIYEARCPGGVGQIEYDENGYLVFRAMMPGTAVPEEATAVETQPQETIPEETVPEEPAEEPRLGRTLKKVKLYSNPSTADFALGTLEAGQEITIRNQITVNGENWGLITEGCWVPMEHIALVNAAAARMAEPVQETIPEEETQPQETVVAETVPDAAEAGQVLPDETVPATEPEMVTEPTQAADATEPAAEKTAMPVDATEPAAYAGEDLSKMLYYDPENGERMMTQYVMLPIPSGYTMEIRLAEGALRSELGWTLLHLAYALRSHLLKLLAVCVALFVLCVVYLCCTAARKRGSDVVRAGGMNRIPLDLYLGCDAVLITALAALAMAGGQYLARNDEQLAILFLGAVAYLICLIIVGFFFAAVAQCKTPGGFWWRHSVCGRSAKLLLRGCRGLTVLCEKGWKKGKPMSIRFFRWTGKTIGTFWKKAKKALRWFWDTTGRLCRWGKETFLRWISWFLRNLGRVFRLLPITWQFLLTGFILVFLLYVCLRSYKVGWILVGFGIFFAAILYAASAFAILLENAKRMSKGDLDTKVDDRVLIGGFKDFASELNALADVAVIAAQKQLKSERMKTELITNVSHDIKTPLTSIINYVDLLQKPHTQGQQEQYLEVLSRQSQRLKKLIDDLMEMSKANTGNMAVEIVRMDAAETVNQALGEFSDKLERAQLTPVFRQPEETVEMLADGRLVWRVMSNLLSNAVKYALPGTRIYLDLLQMDGKVIISMKNISREELNVNADELMERFVRGDASRNTEGSGLGLNIAQSLMELQKGQLQILVDGDLFKVTLIFPGA